MSEQLPLFSVPEGSVDERAAVLVLRDWLMSRDTPPEEVEQMGEMLLVSQGVLLGAPFGLVQLAREGVGAQIRRTLLDAAAITAELRAQFPRTKSRQLKASEIAAGVDAHIDGLWKAVAFGLSTELVHTTILCPRGNLEAKGDQVTLRGIERAEAARTRRAWQYVCRVQIDLPRGWALAHRKRGIAAPWDPPPEGWALSGHRWWLQREIDWPDGGP